MALNLLAFGVPALSVMRLLINISPLPYKELETLPESTQTAKVNEVLSRVLHAENVQGTQYFKRIQNMLNSLPNNVPKTIESLVKHRFKAVDIPSQTDPAFTQGIDVCGGKYYIAIDPRAISEENLPFIITHELSHALHNDPLNVCMLKVINSLAITTLAVPVLGLSLTASLGALVVTHAIAFITHSQMIESHADDFAIKHCSKEDLEAGIAFFKACNTEECTYNPLAPSTYSRIEKIKQALLGKTKVA